MQCLNVSNHLYIIVSIIPPFAPHLEGWQKLNLLFSIDMDEQTENTHYYD